MSAGSISPSPHIRHGSAPITSPVVIVTQALPMMVALGWFLLAGAPAQGGGKVAADSIPPELVGRWGFAVASGDYCTDLAHCTAGSGGSISFKFAQDGRADYALFQSAFVEGCDAVRSLVVKRGKIAVGSGIIVFTPSAGTYESINGCRPDLTGTWKFGPNDLKPVSLHWRLERETLRITDPTGEASGVYSRR